MNDFAVIMREATRRAERETEATKAIRAMSRQRKVCILCCHERGTTIPVGSRGVCARHRAEAGDDPDSLRGVLIAALDEMDALEPVEGGDVA